MFILRSHPRRLLRLRSGAKPVRNIASTSSVSRSNLRKESGARLLLDGPKQPRSIVDRLVDLKHTRVRFFIRYNHGASSRVVPFILPDIGEGINEVEIKTWLIKVGDAVKEFDMLCEVESDKATATISSRFEGTITKIHYEVGDMAKVGSPLVDIQVGLGTDPAPADSSVSHPIKEDGGAADLKTKLGQIDKLATEAQVATLPSVRRLAAENNVDLREVLSTGKNGRILKDDLLRHLKRSPSAVDTQSLGSKFETRDISSSQQVDKKESRVVLQGIRKAMFKTMTQSARIPHFNYSDEIDMTRLVGAAAIRSAENKVSNLAVIIKMVSRSLLEHPELNASVDESGEFITVKHYHNIGVAVDSKSGLIVPNIKNVENLSIYEINSELLRLRRLAYESKLGPTDLSGGTFTLSNIGAIGGIFGVPLLVSPEIVIGALGRTHQVPRFNSAGQIEARHVMQLVWSADHRVVDGATLSRFTNLLKTLLEEPANALLGMK